MENYRFYLEYKTRQAKRKKQDLGTVVAVWHDKKAMYQGGRLQNGDVTRDCASTLEEGIKANICGSQCSDGYLRERCKRVSEARAREIHPQLFTYLEQ